MPFVISALVLAFAANLCFALTGDAVGMFAGQILAPAVYGLIAIAGIAVMSRSRHAVT
jgi:SET family sugar efflux transporter-like MFS transporter